MKNLEMTEDVANYTSKIIALVQPQANWAPDLLRQCADAKEFWSKHLPKPKNEGTNDVSSKE
jgi:hypothetical protein